MKNYIDIVRDTGLHNVNMNVSINIRRIVWRNVSNTVWLNVRDNVRNNVWDKHKLFEYNYLKQYKDNL
jgi:hypothetical protein